MEIKVVNLREELEKKGLTKTQLNSKCVHVLEEIIAENNGEIPEGMTGLTARLIEELESENQKAVEIIKTIPEINNNLKQSVEEYNKILNTIRDFKTIGEQILEGRTITDPDNIEVLNLYAEVLDVSKAKIPTELLTENVLIAILQNASYMAWRSFLKKDTASYNKNVPSRVSLFNKNEFKTV